jgi:hypothetical protein
MTWAKKEEHVTCLSFPCMDDTDMLEQYSRTVALALAVKNVKKGNSAASFGFLTKRT